MTVIAAVGAALWLIPPSWARRLWPVIGWVAGTFYVSLLGFAWSWQTFMGDRLM